MGTIRINPFAVTETGSFTLTGGAATPQDALSGLGGRVTLTFPPSGNTTYELDCEPGTQILIDGVLTNFASLPAGFKITALNLIFTAIINSPTHFTSFDLSYNNTSVYSNPNVPNGGPGSKTIDITGMVPVDLFNNHWAMTLVTDNIDPTDATCNADGLYITGTFALLNFTSILSGSTQPVQGGSQITVTSDPNDPNAMDLSQLTEIDVTGAGGLSLTIPAVDFITATTNLLVFDLPSFGGIFPPTITLAAVGNGVQFSGSITLGVLETIYFINAPGIYKLDPNATADTLYNPDGGTLTVPIPTPFFKTGFVGS